MVTLLTQILAASGGGSGTYTDRSLAIASGGVSETLAAALATRIHILIQNPSSEIESIFVNFTDDATSTGDSVELAPGAYQIFSTTEAVKVLAATTGHKVIAKELAT
jgi:hypothetical protein